MAGSERSAELKEKERLRSKRRRETATAEQRAKERARSARRRNALTPDEKQTQATKRAVRRKERKAAGPVMREDLPGVLHRNNVKRAFHEMRMPDQIEYVETTENQAEKMLRLVQLGVPISSIQEALVSSLAPRRPFEATPPRVRGES